MFRVLLFSVSICLIFFSLGLSAIAAEDEQLGLSSDPNHLEIVEILPDEILVDQILPDEILVDQILPDEISVDQLTVNAGSVFLAEEVDVYAVDAPSGHWIEVSGAPVDLIYIPANYAENSFYLSNGQLYSMNSATITGYADGYSFRFAPYSTPQYRNDDTTYTWRDVNLTLIDSQGVEIEGYNYYFDQEFWLFLAAVGVIMLCLFMRR